MTCAHSHSRNATSREGRLIKLHGGPRVFANLDDRFFSEWLYFCDDCHAKIRADNREVAGLIHRPMEWTGNRQGVPDGAGRRDAVFSAGWVRG